ncbi:hypothetical protein SynPROSU1_00871 [Synechococcus sp. PROS-U-1]|nr:hypothetical protein SynPROSU1_00871 [Synechococcus sp. PROS-U-1]
MEAAFRGDNRGQLTPAGAQFPTTGCPALEGAFGGPLAGFGRLYLAFGLGGQLVQAIGGAVPEPAAAGIDASGRASSAISVA